jgi:hypothetical protein
VSETLRRLRRYRREAEERLGETSSQTFRGITAVWREALFAVADEFRGPAHLEVRLQSDWVLPLPEVAAGLAILNRGPGPAHRVVAALQEAAGYEVVEGKVEVGSIYVGKEGKASFDLRPEAADLLELQFLLTYGDSEQPDKTVSYEGSLRILDGLPAYRQIDNPYTYGLPLEPDAPTYVEREDVSEFIRRHTANVANRRVLALVGGRRTGKTTILKQLPERVENKQYLPVFVDLQGFADPGLENFFLMLSRSISRGLRRYKIRVATLKRADLGDSPQQAFEELYLARVLEAIGPDRVVLLAIDEFDALAQLVREGILPRSVFGYLRHLMQHEPQLAFILAGTHNMIESISSYASEFFNIAQIQRIGYLSREATEALIQDPVRPYGVVYDPLAVEEIIGLTACHPFFTQMLCYILIERCIETERNYVSVQDVRSSEQELLQKGSPHLEFIWKVANATARLFIAALAELQNKLERVTANDILEYVGHYVVHPTHDEVSAAVRNLVAEGIVEETPGYLDSYHLTTQLYARWLQLYHPLEKTANNEVYDGSSDR